MVLKALQFEHAESLTCTEMPLADVKPHMALLLLEAAMLRLQAYAPTYNTLIDPPYEFAPSEKVPLVLKALQFEHAKSLTCTETPIADVVPHMLLLLEAEPLALQAYAPTYNTLIDPPYEFAPKEPMLLVLKALQFEHAESLTCTEMPLADVVPHMALLLLEAELLRLQAYAPTYNTLIDPPYEFAPKDWVPLVLKALQFEHAEPLTCTEMPLADVVPHKLLLLLKPKTLKLQAYAPTYNTLIDPPYEFAPLDWVLLVLKALQFEHAAPLTYTEMPLADVVPHMLLL
jgi:hypothetical protein